jgi:hypothetical protein
MNSIYTFILPDDTKSCTKFFNKTNVKFYDRISFLISQALFKSKHQKSSFFLATKSKFLIRFNELPEELKEKS